MRDKAPERLFVEAVRMLAHKAVSDLGLSRDFIASTLEAEACLLRVTPAASRLPICRPCNDA